MQEEIDWKVIIVTGLMILALCIAFFVLGYGMDQQRKVNYANKFILEFKETYPCDYSQGIKPNWEVIKNGIGDFNFT